MIIRRLTPENAAAYRKLRIRGLRESPTAFGTSSSEEARRPVQAFADRLEQTNTNWIFGAFENELLVGVVTLIRDAKRKERHKASIFGMYVDRKYRRRGIGRQLLNRALDTARRMTGLQQVRLGVVEKNGPALRLYERVGFTRYGREERALFVGGKYYSELLLVCRL